MRKENVRLLQKVSIFLAVIIVPFWIGREIAIPYFLKLFFAPNFGYELLRALNFPDWLFLCFAWSIITATLFFVIDFTVVEKFRYPKRWALAGLALVQFISGFGFLRVDFANRTLVVFQDQAPKADALDFGIITGIVGFLIYVLLFILALIFSKKRLQLAVRRQPTIWVFFGAELLALLLALIGPLPSILNFVI
jgi:hypothetical protein